MPYIDEEQYREYKELKEKMKYALTKDAWAEIIRDCGGSELTIGKVILEIYDDMQDDIKMGGFKWQ